MKNLILFLFCLFFLTCSAPKNKGVSKTIIFYFDTEGHIFQSHTKAGCIKDLTVKQLTFYNYNTKRNETWKSTVTNTYISENVKVYKVVPTEFVKSFKNK